MTAAIVTAWLHYLAVIFMAGFAVTELYLLKLLPSAETLKVVSRVDLLYGIAAAAVLLTGFARMPLPHGGKGMAYYFHTGAFHGALTLFVIAAIVSLVPTFRYIKWKKASAAGVLPSAQAWAGTAKLIHVQLGAIALIALLMPMMAKGVTAAG